MGGRVVDRTLALLFGMLGGVELVCSLGLWALSSPGGRDQTLVELLAVVGLAAVALGVLCLGVCVWDEQCLARRGLCSWRLRWSEIATCAVAPTGAGLPMLVITDLRGHRHRLAFIPSTASTAGLFDVVWSHTSAAREAEDALVARGESTSCSPVRGAWWMTVGLVLAGAAVATLALTGRLASWFGAAHQPDDTGMVVGLAMIYLAAMKASILGAHQGLPRLGPEGIRVPACPEPVYLRWHEVRLVCLRHVAGGSGEQLVVSGAGRSVRLTADLGSWLSVLRAVRRMAPQAEFRDETTSPRHPRWEALLRDVLGPLDRQAVANRPDPLPLLESLMFTRRQKPLALLAVLATAAAVPLHQRLGEVTRDMADARRTTATVAPSQVSWMPMVLYAYTVGADHLGGEAWRIPGRDGSVGAGAKVAVGYRASDPKRSWLWTAEPPVRVARARTCLAAALLTTLLSSLLSMLLGIGDRRRQALL